MESNSGVYQITFDTNHGKRFYIGSAVDLHKRQLRHINDMNKGNHCNRYLQRLWNKYHSFDWEVLENCDVSILKNREQYWLDKFYEYKENVNYNYVATGGAPLHLPDKHKANISKGLKNLSNDKRKEWIEKMIAKRTGKLHSEETKQKMSQSQIGRQFSDETKQKMSQAQIGRKLPDEWKRNISLGGKGRKLTDEQKANCSEAAKKRWERRKLNIASKEALNYDNSK